MFLDILLSRLEEEGIFTHENQEAVLAHSNHFELAITLGRLQEANLLTQDNLSTILMHTNPIYLGLALSNLHRAGILTEQNRKAVSMHAIPSYFARTLSYLEKARLLTQDNFNIVLADLNPHVLSMAIYALRQAEILTQDNFNALIMHECPMYLNWVLCHLKNADILNQANFDTLLLPNHLTLLEPLVWQQEWSRIPPHLLNQVNFERLLIAAEQENPFQELTEVTNQILDFLDMEINPNVFNSNQSTHTASVHRSVSNSARNLMASYGHQLNLEQTLREVVNYIHSLEKNDSCKRCIERLTQNDFSFQDTSGISIPQLLALAWLAIHDSQKSKAHLENAKTLFIQGLHEIQRGYNIDDGAEDRPICAAGTFNKLVEKLQGIHDDVEINYITLGGASAKFPKLAQDEALNYLQSIANTKTAEHCEILLNLLTEIQTTQSLAPIWDDIREKVRIKLWDEFKEAFAYDSNHTKFLELLDNGQYLPAFDTSSLDKDIQSSKGYQAYLGIQHGLNCNYLWSNRHNSMKDQNDYDKQYGIIIRP